MRQSNLYIIIFTAIMTIVVGGLLSATSQLLGPAQQKSIELDTKGAILGSVMNIEEAGLQGQALLDTYDSRIKSVVVDINGDEITTDEKGNPIVASEVNILKNYKKAPEERMYPVFMYMNESDPSKVDAYILPMYGAGLWDAIWGFVAMDNSFNNIVGVSFDHKGETPGLGARISSPEVQGRYTDKKIFDESGELKSVTMVKGEGHAGLTDYQVDGLSGATLTGKGLNDMLKNYFGYYSAYIDKVKGNSNTTATIL